MGGGGAMKAAAKAAGIGAFNTGVRGGAAVVIPPHPPEHAVRNASRPVSAIISHNNSPDAASTTATVQRPTWELDDWEFAGFEVEEEMLIKDSPVTVAGAGEPDPSPRVVFGGAPSLDEAKTATSELKEALEKVYLSNPSHGRTFGVAQQSPGRSLPGEYDRLETKSCVMFEPKAAVPVPKYAVQAFTMLNESPAVQSVVASIASDPNVWDAVLQNPDLQEYVQSYKTHAEPNKKEFVEVVGSNDIGSKGKFSEVSNGESEATVKSGSNFEVFIENVKHSVVEMASNIVSFVQNVFGFQSAEHAAEADRGETKESVFDSNTLGKSFMALAVMVIMVVLLKRA